MTFTHILVFTAAALLYLIILPPRLRAWALYAGSVVAIFWLQPPLLIDKLDFIFPLLTLGLVVLSWLITRAKDQRWTRDDTAAAVLLIALVFAVSAGRYLRADLRITPSRPPLITTVALWVGGGLLALAVLGWVRANRYLTFAILQIVALFFIIKAEPLAEEAARRLRDLMGQPPELARAAELEWLGFSYVAFRLIHTMRDRQTGKLPALNLREYITYAIFFPAYTAGPIDRAERFLPDLRQLPGLDPTRLTQGGLRILIGIGKKFVIADSLAYFALDAAHADQANSAGALWFMLYAYAFRLYFDFSGYSDIAIGIGQLYGIKLPENFNQPYLKRNITTFWQSWHITLSNWVRFYVFSPLSRSLIRRKYSQARIVLIGQTATMIIIGLWHGVTGHFVIWGIWHALGLYIHKLYSDRTRQFYVDLRDRPRLSRAIEIGGIVLTFHFVLLGWVWFALPDLTASWDVFTRLFGF